jgi:hypothetical protein
LSYNYTTYVSQLSNLMAASSSTPQFVTFLPGCIDYAEQRIYRELDLLNTVVRDNSANFTATVRNFTLPSSGGIFVTVQRINAVSPVATSADNGTRLPLTPTSPEYIDTVWGNAATVGIPSVFAMIDNANIIVGPSPSASFGAEVVGTIRPTPLSVSNVTTFLTTNLPELFMAASMVFASGYMRNFGAQSDDPAKAVSWETQYQALFQSAKTEQIRSKFAALGWTSYSTGQAPER